MKLEFVCEWYWSIRFNQQKPDIFSQYSDIDVEYKYTGIHIESTACDKLIMDMQKYQHTESVL